MGSVFARGNRLYVNYKNAAGKWQQRRTEFVIGQEELAKKALLRLEEMVTAGAEFGEPDGKITVDRYAQRWLDERERRGLASVDDDRSRYKNHVKPDIGQMLLDEVRPRHIRALVRKMDTKLAARSTRSAYGMLHCMMADAVADELIEVSPCQLRRGDLPRKVDKDPTWRATAVFTRDEIEVLISSEIVPEDRRTLYAIMFLAGGLRFGEAAALRWRLYDGTTEPLGRLLVAHSFDVHKHREKSVKTEVPRQVPVHPTLAAILAEWKLSGWQRLMGRPPEADDLIVPSREGKNRNVNHGLKRFHQDLDRLGMRKRRQHDIRRTFISLAIGDGARKDVLRWITHGPTGDIMDLYTTMPWPALCEEMSKLKVGVRKGELVSLRKVAEAHGGGERLGANFGATSGSEGSRQEKSQESQGLLASHHQRGGRDSNPRPPA